MLLPAVILALLATLTLMAATVAFLLWKTLSGQEYPGTEHKQQQEDEHALWWEQKRYERQQFERRTQRAARPKAVAPARAQPGEWDSVVRAITASAEIRGIDPTTLILDRVEDRLVVRTSTGNSLPPEFQESANRLLDNDRLRDSYDSYIESLKQNQGIPGNNGVHTEINLGDWHT